MRAVVWEGYRVVTKGLGSSLSCNVQEAGEIEVKEKEKQKSGQLKPPTTRSSETPYKLGEREEG